MEHMLRQNNKSTKEDIFIHLLLNIFKSMAFRLELHALLILLSTNTWTPLEKRWKWNGIKRPVIMR